MSRNDSKFTLFKPNFYIAFFASLFIAGVSALFAGAASANDDQLHQFPLVVDGEGFRTYLFLTDFSDSGNRCLLELGGAGMEVARFEENAALTVSGESAEIMLGGTGGVMLRTAGKRDLALGYANIDCVEPAAARMLLVRESAGEPIAMTSLDPVQTRYSFQFPVLHRLGRFALVVANDNAMDATCAVELETAAGMSAGGGNVNIPAWSTMVRFLDEIVPLPETADGGTAGVSCSRAVTALGLPFGSSDIAALESFDLEVHDESQAYQILPLVFDGGGFQSHLLVTNLADAGNQCSIHFHGAGVSTARFPTTEDVTKDGFRRAMFELKEDGGSISMLSFGRHFHAYGYAVLDCIAPVAARNLLSLSSEDAIAGMAAVPPTQMAAEVEFPVAPQLSRMAFFLTNASDADASCELSLAANGRDEPISAEMAIQIESESTSLRFLADSFEVPDEFPGGVATLSCDRNILAVAISYAGSAFAAISPVVVKVDTSPVFGEDSVIENQSYPEGEEIEKLQLPEATGGNGELAYSLTPGVPGTTFDPATRELTGTPARPGAYELTFTATDDDGDHVSLDFTVTVKPKPQPESDPESESEPEPDSVSDGGGAKQSSSPDTGDCRVGYRITPVNRYCLFHHQGALFFSFSISKNPDGSWQGVYSGALVEGFTAGPARLTSGDGFLAVRASDNATWTILRLPRLDFRD